MSPQVPERALVPVVDDYAASVCAASAALEANDFEVVMARNGRSALRRAAFSQPDLILMDVQMPDMDRFERYRQLGLDRGRSRITAIPHPDSRPLGRAPS